MATEAQLIAKRMQRSRNRRNRGGKTPETQATGQTGQGRRRGGRQPLQIQELSVGTHVGSRVTGTAMQGHDVGRDGYLFRASAVLRGVTTNLAGGVSQPVMSSHTFDSSGFGTWAKAQISLWDKFRVVRLEIRWEPIVGSISNGSLVMYFDSDPADAGTPTYADASAQAGAVITPIWAPARMVVPPRLLATQKWFSVASPTASNAFTAVGKLQYNTTELSLFPQTTGNSVSIGHFWADATIELLGRNVPAAP